MADKEKKQESELAKARGETEAQQEAKAYHEGDFQTTDPVTGEPRGKLMNWQDPDDEDDASRPIGEELTPDELKKRQEEEVKRSAGPDAPRSTRKAAAAKKTPTARKTPRKRGR